jgi:hypothetical protein
MYAITTTAQVQLPANEKLEYARLHDATAKADALAARLVGAEFEVTETESRTVAYVTSQRAILKRDEGVHFVPWTRLEVPKFSAPEIAGFYPAYTRKRIEAVVYRAVDEDAELPWLVRDGRTGGTQLCANTTESRKLLTAMRNGRML